MYDTVKFILLENDLDNEICFMEEVACRINIEKCSANKVIGYIRNMRVEVRGTTLIVEGSLTKWFLGNNYARTLALWEIRAAIKSLSKALNVPIEKAKVTRIDVAFNFSVKNEPWRYMKRLLFLESYYRSNIDKSSLYFDKYDSQLLFYDKVADLKTKEDAGSIQGVEDFEGLNVLRYELRIKKVTKIFGEVRGEILFDSEFCLLLLNKWYMCYMNIDKQFDESPLRFDGVRHLKESCVAQCMSAMNMFDLVEEAFAKGNINSAEKFAIIKELRRIADLCFNRTQVPLINEFTTKIKNAHINLKRRYSVASRRLEMLKRWVDG